MTARLQTELILEHETALQIKYTIQVWEWEGLGLKTKSVVSYILFSGSIWAVPYCRASPIPTFWTYFPLALYLKFYASPHKSLQQINVLWMFICKYSWSPFELLLLLSCPSVLFVQQKRATSIISEMRRHVAGWGWGDGRHQAGLWGSPGHGPAFAWWLSRALGMGYVWIVGTRDPEPAILLSQRALSWGSLPLTHWDWLDFERSYSPFNWGRWSSTDQDCWCYSNLG